MATRLLWLALLLSSCSSPDAGIVAARDVGMDFYVSFQRYGRQDSAAMFRHNGYWWRYHPSKGSVKTPWKATEPPPIGVVLAIDGASGPIQKVAITRTPSVPIVENGCLPRAIMLQRIYGGSIVMVGRNHVEHVP